MVFLGIVVLNFILFFLYIYVILNTGNGFKRYIANYLESSFSL